VAIYVAANNQGESQRLEAVRKSLIAQEQAIDFAPERNDADLAILKALVEKKDR
jgi:hypothetical protein